MSLRSKTKHRLLLLAVLFIGALIALLIWRTNRAAKENARLEQYRQAGMAAYARNDYGSAIEPLRLYLASHKSGTQGQQPAVLDALLALADCKLRAGGQNSDDLKDADKYLDEYLDARKDDEKALRLRLDLYRRQNRWPDLVKVADDLLKIKPEDPDALWAKTLGLTIVAKPDYAAARDTIVKLLKVSPRHIDALNRQAEIKLRAGVAPTQVVDESEKMLEAYPNDPGVEAAVARANLDAAMLDQGHRKTWIARSIELLGKAATRPTNDAVTILSVIGGLDETLQFKAALDYLTKAVDTLKDPALEMILIRRLWQCDEYDKVLERSAKMPADSPATHPDVLAMQVMSLRALAANKQPAEKRTRLLNQADTILAALGKRENPVAQQWTALLKLEAENAATATGNAAVAPATAPTEVAAAPATTLHGVVKQYRDIAAINPSNAVAVARVGDALQAVEEDDLAAAQWKKAMDLQREWAYPYAQSAAMRMRTSSPADAARYAEQALIRAPDSRPINALFLLTRFRWINSVSEAKSPATTQAAPLAAKLLEDVDAFVKRYGVDDAVTYMQVALRAKYASKEAAVKAVDAALAHDPPPSLQTLVQLLSLDDQQKLGVGQKLESAITKQEGGKGALAVRHALLLNEEGKPQAGLQEMLAAQKQAKGENDKTWMLKIAIYMDRAGIPDAPVALAAVADKFPNDPFVQLQVLKTPSVRLQRDLWFRVTENLRKLSGEDGTRWKLERAAWFLAGPPNPATRKEAITLLREVITTTRSFEAMRLMARAFREDGQYDRAAEALQRAREQRPDHIPTILDLARTLMQARKPVEAAAQLAVLKPADLSPDDLLGVAILYEQLGRSDRAIDLLQLLPAGAARDTRLGRLYRAAGKNNEAEAAFQRLLEDKGVPPIDLVTAADFFASNGKPDVAQKFLDRLADSSTSPAMTEIFLAQYQERHGGTELAKSHLIKATELDPKSELAWRALAGYRLRTGDIAGAQKAVDSGLAVAAKSAELSALNEVLKVVRKMPQPQRLNGLISYLSGDPAHPAARATLDVLAASQAAEEAAAKQGPQAQAQVRRQLQDRLVQLARDYPDFWPLQEVVIRHYLRTDMNKAAETAWSATPNFVGNPEPPHIAAEAYANLRRWTRVTEAATIWRQRSGADTVPADILLAEAQIAQKQTAAALRILEPLVAAHPLPASGAATQPAAGGLPPQTLLDLHRTYGRALLAAGKSNEAQEALKPMLSMGAEGRSAWMAAASAATDAVAARQWLERVAAGIPRGAVNEFVALADSWLECGRKLRDVSLLKSADALLDPLTTDGKPPVDALRLLGLTSHYLGDYDKAERCWRAVAEQSKGTDPEAMNNLAYVLLVRGNAKDVAEATSLAEKAVAASAEPAFLGTLAKARSKNNDRAGAITAYRQALAKDAASGVDDNVESRLGLAEELSRGKEAERTEALRLVLEAKRLMDAGQLQPPEIQKALAALQEALK